MPAARPRLPLYVLAPALILAQAVAAQQPQRALRTRAAMVADPTPVETLAQLRWRSIGPANMGGRVTAVAGLPGNPNVFWVAGADGGVFRTTNAGTTWEEQFTNQPVYSVGALAVAPADPNVLWLGSGEGDPRNSASFGNGVYRSTDGGRTWKHLGLDDSERIKRIAVHPTDPDVAWVCALGHAWGPNETRGVFRTRDAGKTWEKVFYIDQDTGCSDISIDVSNPRILYAGMYTFRRRPWYFESGGKQTALYRTIDGGDTWQTLRGKPGYPTEPQDRIGVAVAPSRPLTVYMITETKTQGELFRSDDGGESWRMVNADRQINFRPFYYADIRIDPLNAERLYSLSGGLYRSTDGGRSFQSIGGGVHGDHQAFWIDPQNPMRLISGSDGGFQLSFDGGDTWNILNNIALSQFYHIDFDMQQPYYVCGGLQDNGTWCGPSGTAHSEGILKNDWFTISGGDGFYGVPVPGQPIVFSNSQGGNIFVTDLRTGNSRSIHPYPNKVGSAGDAMLDHKYRFNWDAPILVSPHDPNTVYFGGNVLFRSKDGGHSWQEISPDLTTDDPAKQQSSGGEIVTDNTAAEFHTTILTIAESPVRAGVIWVGTDDGNIQITQDGGANWTNVIGNVRGLPANSWVSRIDASHFDAGTAYVAIDRHQENDFAPYVYMTTDYGRTWSALQAGLPAKGYVHVVREDPHSPDLLYVGTELGVFASWDRGRTWRDLRNGLPPVAVRDIKIHPRENDLILATHGRGVFILDDLTPLQKLTEATAQDAFLFEPRPARRWQLWSREANLGSATFVAPNPPAGAILNFWLKARPEQPVSLTVSDARGQTVRQIPVNATAGVNRTVWDLRYVDPRAPQPAAGGGGGRGRGGGPGAFVVPGDYQVTLQAGGRQLRTPVKVEADPRITMSAADYQAQFNAVLELQGLSAQVTEMVNQTEDIRRQLAELETTLRRNPGAVPGSDASLASEIARALQEVTQIQDALRRPPPAMGYRQKPELREEINSLSGAIGRAAAPPTEPQKLRAGELRQETTQASARFNTFVAQTIGGINRRLGGAPRIITGRPIS